MTSRITQPSRGSRGPELGRTASGFGEPPLPLVSTALAYTVWFGPASAGPAASVTSGPMDCVPPTLPGHEGDTFDASLLLDDDVDPAARTAEWCRRAAAHPGYRVRVPRKTFKNTLDVHGEDEVWLRLWDDCTSRSYRKLTVEELRELRASAGGRVAIVRRHVAAAGLVIVDE